MVGLAVGMTVRWLNASTPLPVQAAELRIANTNAYSYADGNSDCNGDADRNPNGQPHCNSIGNGHAATDANTQVGAIRKAAAHASTAPIESRRTGNFWCSVTGVGNRWFVVLARRARSDAPYLHARTRADLGRAGSPLHADFHRPLPRPD